jgi:glycosyltransferase involved in cell wall biosynthesis
VVTTGEVLAGKFAQYGVPVERILVHPNGVDPARFAAARAGRAERRAAWGIDADATVAVYVGSLYAHKGLATLLHAAARSPATTFLVAGGDDEQVEAWHREGVPGNVRFLGFVPNAEVPGLLAAADVGLVPNSASDRTAAYTFSLKLYEYLAAGLPVVASDIPSLRSAMGDDPPGALVPPDDPEALAAALARLADDPAERARCRALAEARARASTWDARARRILERFAPQLLPGAPG